MFRIGRHAGSKLEILANPSSPLFKVSQGTCTVLSIAAATDVAENYVRDVGVKPLEPCDLELIAVEPE